MSRARPWEDPQTGETTWFDNRSIATPKHLELLADVEGIDLDDLLDEGLTQKQVLHRLYIGHDLIPAEVLERRRRKREEAAKQPICRICSFHGWTCEGRITRHHFIPRWLMRELSNYEAYAVRSRCTIPICIGRHRDLHLRSSKADKSILPYLDKPERELAEKMLSQLREERPAIFELLSGGDFSSYEAQLMRDFSMGAFRHSKLNLGVNIIVDDRMPLDVALIV